MAELSAGMAALRAENEQQKAHIAQLLLHQQRRVVVSTKALSSSLRTNVSSSVSHPPSPPSPSSSLGLMGHWKRRERALMADVEQLRASLQLSQQQHQLLLDSHERLVHQSRPAETDSGRLHERAESTIARLRERLTRERTRRSLCEGELRALKRLHDNSAAHQLREDSALLQQVREAKAEADEAQERCALLLEEERQHEETARALQAELELVQREKAELESQLRASEDVIASLIPLEDEVSALTEELAMHREAASRRDIEDEVRSEHRQQLLLAVHRGLTSITAALQLPPPSAVEEAQQIAAAVRVLEERAVQLMAAVGEKEAEARQLSATAQTSGRRARQLELRLREQVKATSAAQDCHKLSMQTAALLYQRSPPRPSAPLHRPLAMHRV